MMMTEDKCVDGSNSDTAAEKTCVTDEQNKISRFRTLLPQIVASTGKNLLLLDLGLAVAFPTIVIPALRGLQPDRNTGEMLSFTVAQASWLGSLAYILKPIGSALSGWVAERIGRKRAMLMVNIPHLIAWPMLSMANSTTEIFVAAILLGLGVGFMEAPVVTYVGEICQPSIRGILVACSSVAVMLGFFLMYLLGAIMQWRSVAMVCVSLPIVAFTAICFLPETPLWLLSKGREDEALRSLQWLRGWVEPQYVATEFNEMKRYRETASGCTACQKADQKCTHPKENFAQTLRELKRKCSLRPFSIVIFCFLISQYAGMHSIRPYMVQIFNIFGVPIDPNWTTVLIGIMSLVANIAVMCTISVIGKRKLYFVSLTGTAMSCFSLGMYAYQTIPLHQSSFDVASLANVTSDSEALRDAPTAAHYFAMVMFLSLAFFTSLGAAPLPWMYMSEVFPYKTRGIATGLTAATHYVFAFFAIKLYANIESTLTIFGTFVFFGLVSVIGLLVLYVILPETEGRTLEEIEQFFSDNKRPLTDRHVRKITSDATNDTAKGGCDNIAFNERV